MSKIVVALGGNALGNTVEEQLDATKIAASAIADLVVEGNEVILVHGNGPQVGQIRLAFEDGFKNKVAPFMPFAECIALSQGYIGYHLQQSINKELTKRGVQRPVVTLLTQVVVDKNDPAFQNPTKPVGGYYTKEEAESLMAKSSDKYVEDAGRGYRRVVPSPKPMDIIEKESIKQLVDAKNIVIACGGGGIPVYFEGNDYKGVDSVIDKDFAAAKLADLLECDALFVLTAVDRVCVNFNKPNQEEIAEMTIADCEKYIGEGQFAPGSMLPKVEAAMKFVQGGNNRRAIIGSLEKAKQSIKGESGTAIVK